jgi:transposase
MSVYEWAEIRRLSFVEGLSARQIAERLGCNRRTVQKALSSPMPPGFSGPPRASSFDVYEPRVRALLTEYPKLPATVLAERLGWEGSASYFRKRIAALRPEFRPVDPADRTTYEPGEIVQCDLWFPPRVIPADGEMLAPPVLTMVACFSRTIVAMAIPTRTTEDLAAGMWCLLDRLGGAPRTLVWDNEAGIGRRNTITPLIQTLAGTVGSRIWQTKPYDPESKGVVERANRFLKESFLPGRSFVSGDDFNAQLAAWLPGANERKVRAIGGRPADLIGHDLARMRPLPALHPHFGFQTRHRLGRDYYVRVLGNDYSLDPSAIGRMVDIRADLARVTAHLGGHLIADHARSWGHGNTFTDPEHLATAGALRRNLANQKRYPGDVVVPIRNLADYDDIFGTHASNTTEGSHA